MNKRIQELAEQAKGFVDLNQHLGGDNGCMVYTYDGLEKFAELIIQECIEIVISSDPSPKMILHEPYRTVMNNIVDHFGVE